MHVYPSCCEEALLCYGAAAGAFGHAEPLRASHMPHLVCSVLGTNMRNLNVDFSHLFPARLQSQRSIWPFDTVTSLYGLTAPDASFTTTLWAFEHRNYDMYLLAAFSTSLGRDVFVDMF